VNFKEKLISWENLPAWREGMRRSGRKLVVTNGCFDLLHLGHVTYLEEARNTGDALLVGVNSDQAVLELKGEGRPVTAEMDRALILAALASVDAVCVFPGTTAISFLQAAKPDVYVKGGDYTIDRLNQDERRVVEEAGGRIVVAPLVQGRSTSATLEKITEL
jgi:rfaE bifunctional protein nucleotidyltransferase chain/domain